MCVCGAHAIVTIIVINMLLFIIEIKVTLSQKYCRGAVQK